MLFIDSKTAVHDAIRHWSSLPELATFAVARHGYGCSNGGFGVTYPGDLDEHDREVLRIHIPQSFVQVYGFWGPPAGYEILVLEIVYLGHLLTALVAAGHETEAEQIRSMLRNRDSTPAERPDPAT